MGLGRKLARIQALPDSGVMSDHRPGDTTRTADKDIFSAGAVPDALYAHTANQAVPLGPTWGALARLLVGYTF